MVETGLTRHQNLTITGWDPVTGDVTATSDLGISFTTKFKEIESQLVQELQDAEAMLVLYGNTNATLRDF